jgi:hypothetical protein
VGFTGFRDVVFRLVGLSSLRTAQVQGNEDKDVDDVFGAVSLSLLEPTCFVPKLLCSQLGLSQVNRGIFPPPPSFPIPIYGMYMSSTYALPNFFALKLQQWLL